jgi:CHASE3 domain sensor protein
LTIDRAQVTTPLPSTPLFIPLFISLFIPLFTPMRISLVVKIILSFAATACGFAAAAFLFWNEATALRTSLEATPQAESTLSLADALLEQLRQSEAGQQGYIITNDSLYLESYSNAVGQMGVTMQQLYALPNRSQLTNDQLSRLDTLLAKKFNEFNLSLQLKREKKYIQPAANVIVKSKGRLNTDSIRATIETLRREQQSTLQGRTTQAASQFQVILQQALALGAAALALLLLLALLATLGIKKSLRELTASVEKFTLGDFFHRAAEPRAPELRGVATALNTMAANIQTDRAASQRSQNLALEALNATAHGVATFAAVHGQHGNVVDFVGTVINPAAASILGLSADEVQHPERVRLSGISKSAPAAAPAAEHDAALLTQCKQVLDTAQNLALRHIVTANGTSRSVLFTISRHGDGVTLNLSE